MPGDQALGSDGRKQVTQDLEGGCACAAVRYRLASLPMFVHCCHCRDCQRQTGSAFVLNALIETDRVAVLSGNPEPVAVPTDSGRPHHIYRCPCRRTLDPNQPNQPKRPERRGWSKPPCKRRRYSESGNPDRGSAWDKPERQALGHTGHGRAERGRTTKASEYCLLYVGCRCADCV